ncbi:MAG TPA: cytochrome c oxidase assembly protein [Acidimicrobiales bacterium]|nr:cytochrome c oxidase assembly protein [Acidimicrobiales bacterium]
MWSSSAPASDPAATPDRLGAWAAAVAVVAGLAVVSPPADRLADRHLAAHMLQHVVLLSVTAPLLAFALARAVRGGAWSAARLTGSVVAIAIVVPLWHLPALYDAAERSIPLHLAEHATFVVVAVWFWSEVLAGYRAGAIGALVALCAGATPGTVLGFLMTFGGSPWYPHYAAFASAVEDQQIAGVVMWTGGNVATLLAVCAVFAGWLRRLDREPASTPRRLPAESPASHLSP